jgi:hypothetical protein
MKLTEEEIAWIKKDAYRPEKFIAAYESLLAPDDDAAVLREAGFSEVTLFYAAFTWRGWVAYV